MPTQDDFQAEVDLDTLTRAAEIEKDPRRLDRAKEYAERRADQLKGMADQIPGRPRKVNNAPRDSVFGRKRA